MSITDKRLTEIQARVEAATEGPWAATFESADNWFSITGAPIDNLVCPEVATVEAGGDAEAVFIANSRADLADALGEIERLQAQLADAWEQGAEAAWKLTGEGWNAEYAGRELHLEKFRDINPNVLNPYRKEEQ